MKPKEFFDKVSELREAQRSISRLGIVPLSIGARLSKERLMLKSQE